MDCASEPGGSAAGTEPRSRRAAVAPSPRIAATLLRGARAAALAVAALALSVPGEAQAQTVTTFISNVGPVDYNRFRRSSRHGVHHGRQHRGIWG